MELVKKLAAIEEIRQLKARYWRIIDTKQFEELNRIFAPDALFDSREALYDPVLGQMPGTEPAAPWQTRAGIVAGVKAAMPPELQSVHMGHTPEIEILSETTATGIIPFNDRLRIPGGLVFNGFGYYHEEYELVDGKWMIKSSRIQRLRVVFDE